MTHMLRPALRVPVYVPTRPEPLPPFVLEDNDSDSDAAMTDVASGDLEE